MRITWIVAALLLFNAFPAQSDQRDKRLPHLFQLLQYAENPMESAAAQARINAIWLESADSKVKKLLDRGIQAMEDSNYAEALRNFNALTKHAPKFAEGWNKRAMLFYMMGDLSASMADIDHVLELEPRHFGALSGLAMIQTAKGNDKAAIDAFERVLHLAPQDVSAKENLEYLRKRLANSAI